MHLRESLWAGSWRKQPGDLTLHREKKAVEMWVRLSWNIPGAWGRTWAGSRDSSRAAAIQLTTLCSHQVKIGLLKAINAISGRGQIQAAKHQEFIGIFPFSNVCAEGCLLGWGHILGVQRALMDIFSGHSGDGLGLDKAILAVFSKSNDSMKSWGK